MKQSADFIKVIESYTICLYGEFCGVCRPIGSGILVQKDGLFYLISAHHVFDREEEMTQIKNDPEEDGIDHDDTDSVFIRIIEQNEVVFYRINDYMTGVVFTAFADEKGTPTINEDTEYAICHLTSGMVQCIHDAGKCFFEIEDTIEKSIDPTHTIIISGYPQYAHKNDVGLHRSFKCEINRNIHSDEKCLLRVMFNNHDAYNLEQLKVIQIPGIDGMSGGGIWKYGLKGLEPIGIILKQDHCERYVEGYSFAHIINDLKRDINKSHEANI